MPILATQISQAGLAGVVPNVAYIATNDTVAQVTAAGYLNVLVQSGYQLSTAMVACVSTKTTPTASVSSAVWYSITFSGGNWSLAATSASSTLPSGNIFVGNASNVATAVAMSGDATISNAGALTIANGAITTVKIGASQVTLAKLAAGITPSSIIVFSAQAAYAGGSATQTLTVTGVLATDVAVANLQASANAVTIEKCTVSANTLTILYSGDPGASTLSYVVTRVAS